MLIIAEHLVLNGLPHRGQMESVAFIQAPGLAESEMSLIEPQVRLTLFGGKCLGLLTLGVTPVLEGCRHML
jgi:hypothetical protein